MIFSDCCKKCSNNGILPECPMQIELSLALFEKSEKDLFF